MNIFLHNKQQRILIKCHSPRAVVQRGLKRAALQGWKVTAIVEETSPLFSSGDGKPTTLQRSISSPLLPNPPYSSAQIALGSYNFRRDLIGEEVTEDVYLQIRRNYEDGDSSKG